MDRQAYEAELARADTALAGGAAPEAAARLDALPERWAFAPETLHLRHRLFRRGQPALLARPLPPEAAQRLSALLNTRRLDAAVTLARSLAAAHPQAATPHEALALAYNAARRFPLAYNAAREALVRAPDRAALYRELALALYETGRFEAMQAPARHAAEALPDDPQAQRMGAVAALIHGDRDTARDRYGRLAALVPENGAAHRGYAELHRYTDRSDPHLKKMLKILKSGKPTPAEQLEFHFALGKAYADLGQADAAFDHYARGNAQKKALHDLGVDKDRQDCAAVRAALPAFYPAPADAQADPVPILIVGLPRSGTTLTESILAAHPQVATAGELPYLRQHLLPLLRAGTPPDPAQLDKVRKGYLETLRAASGGKACVIDKMPANFVLAGPLARLIPQARIVAMHRAPVALGWSVFRQCFVRTGNGFAYDLRDIADYMALYRDMLDTCETSGIALHRLDYATLTDRPEETVAALLQALDLPWDAACLDFAGSGRAVATASALQVRGGIYRGSDEDWRPYAAHLGPLVSRLRDNGLI
ncbi:tetratricopeptide repeat-containing sulfotransferase family protein [Maliponia aquimaris]|uniref:Uncharacterized protein n=1 Tax=Maliponia aquimaris TaxID=1673631 RepID=A0A238K1A0_9RHOB|nr:sulfotransferase [Maliponia aquimaris]SMX36670.1 hypothetical protein MAA8898_00963 [Maliponia aquimaris]